MFLESELILNPDGTIFHLHLRPGQVADTVILVGDPNRVDIIKGYLDEVEFRVANREYVSTTGRYNNKRITIISTGVGVGNIDIVLNELDALVNIDFGTREQKRKKTSLKIIRIGTSGSLQKDIPVNSFVVSEKCIGFDNLVFYHGNDFKIFNIELQSYFRNHMDGHPSFFSPYIVDSSDELLELISDKKRTKEGITVTSPGFYVPQGRELRLKAKIKNINEKLSSFEHDGYRITNYEMESAAIYALSKLMGHRAIAICLIIADRMNKNANQNYGDNMKGLIEYVLKKVSNENQ